MNYRKIWKDANGPIPIDEQGRSYDIHHIDGNRKNNLLENLMCVSIEEHYKIHLEQGDWGACHAIELRMGTEVISSGWTHSQKTKDKISKTLTGRKNGPRPQEVKDKIAKTSEGRVVTEEQKKKISQTLKGRKHSKEAIKKITEASKNRKHTKESIEKMKRIKKDSRFNLEARQKSVEAVSRPVIDLKSKVTYKSRAEACRAFGWKQGKMAYRIKKGEFQYL